MSTTLNISSGHSLGGHTGELEENGDLCCDELSLLW